MDYDFPAFKMLQVSETEYEERKEQRAKNIYEDIIEPALDESFDSRTVFQLDRIQDEMRPPYSYSEAKMDLNTALTTQMNLIYWKEIWIYILSITE